MKNASPVLNLGKGLTLPLDFITKTQAILARKRSGKSYTAQKQAEELLRNHQQIAALDPTGAWWGLRSSADGKREGYPIVVFGGEHADAPLNYSSGAAMAQAFVEHGFSAIYDLGEMTADEQTTFAAAFCSDLYRLNRKAIHLFIDEADVFAPQKTMGRGEEKCLHAVKRLVKMGGVRGIGCTMISQRPAVLNKDVLTQVDIITALRMSHPHDITPVYDWLASEINPEFAKEVRQELPSLPTGTAFIASNLLGIAKRVQVGTKKTFNSGATPKPGETRIEPKVLARIDIVKLGEEIASSVKKAAEESPQGLKKRIAELETELAKGGKADMGVMEEIQAMHTELEELRPLIDKVREREIQLFNLINALQDLVSRAPQDLDIAPQSDKIRLPEPRTKQALIIPKMEMVAESSPSEKMNKAERSILNVLAQFGTSTKSKVAALTGYAINGGGFNNAISSCRTKGWLHNGSDGLLITADGRKALGPISPLPRGSDLLAMWQGRLGKAEREVLAAIVRYRKLSKERVAEVTGYAANGGGFNNALSRLRTLELITGTRELELTESFAAAIGGTR